MAQPEKRTLKFESLDEMFQEIESLHQHGYVSHGNWNLAQCCGHLSEWMRFPVDGYPKPPWFMRVIFWVMKVTIAGRMKRQILSEGFKGGMITAPETVPTPDQATDREAIDQFRAVADRVTAYQGKLHPSPLFGPADMAMHIRITLLHAEHHLGYLAPKND